MPVADWLSPELVRDFEALRQAGVSADLLLPSAFGPITPDIRATAVDLARRTVSEHRSTDWRLRLFGPVAPPSDLAEDAVAVAYLNALALEGALTDVIPAAERRSRAAAAEDRLRDFLSAHGLVPLVRAYCALRAHEHGRALTFYSPMPEETFLSGRLHLPTYPGCCRSDLLYGIANGWLMPVTRGTAVYVDFTPAGRQGWNRLAALLTEAGALEERHRLLQRLTWSVRQPVYRALLDRVLPEWQRAASAFVSFAAIAKGGRVLDLAGHPGSALLLSGTLAEAVGPRGELLGCAELARDPGRGHGRGRPARFLVGARSGRLDLPTGDVDAVVCAALTRLPDELRLLGEARRVLRPGGVLAVLTPAPGGAADFVSPLMAAISEVVLGAPPDPGAVASEALHDAVVACGFVEVECLTGMTELRVAAAEDLVQLILATTGWLQRALLALPVGEQRRRERLLLPAVAEVVARHASDGRPMPLSFSMLRARKPAFEPEQVLRVGAGVSVVGGTWRVYHNGRLLPLPPVCGQILRELAAAGGPLSVDALAFRAGGTGEQTVRNAVVMLRRHMPAGLRIQARRGSGYELVHESAPKGGGAAS